MEKCKSIDLLKNHNLKATKQRLELLDNILSLSNRVFSVKEIAEIGNLSMDQATIYRILNQLNTSGIIREVLTNHDDKRYEISCKHNPVHPHLQCKICSEIKCLDELPLSILDGIIGSYTDDTIEEIAISFKGICKNCSAKEN